MTGQHYGREVAQERRAIHINTPTRLGPLMHAGSEPLAWLCPGPRQHGNNIFRRSTTTNACSSCQGQHCLELVENPIGSCR
jgi:hypothetical protein